MRNDVALKMYNYLLVRERTVHVIIGQIERSFDSKTAYYQTMDYYQDARNIRQSINWLLNVVSPALKDYIEEF